MFADGHQVQQVLLNLIINAEQAMLSANGRGILVVRTWHDVDQDTVVLEINDDGPGFRTSSSRRFSTRSSRRRKSARAPGSA